MKTPDKKQTDDLDPDELADLLRHGEPSASHQPLPDGTFKHKARREIAGIAAMVKYAVDDDQHQLVRNEAAAYLVDRILHLGMVPVTVLRRLDFPQVGEVLASVQAWQFDGMPSVRLDDFDEKATIEAAAFDWLTQNMDRNHMNAIKTGPQSPHGLVLIDHERSFGVRSQPRRPFWEARRGERLSGAFVARVEQLAHAARTAGQLREVLTDAQLEELQARAELLVGERRVPMQW